MTYGEAYCDGILVRVVCNGPRPFTAGLIIDRDTDRVVIAAPILFYLLGQRAAQIRQTFKRLGWRATIVRRRNIDANRAAEKTPDAGAHQAPYRVA